MLIVNDMHHKRAIKKILHLQNILDRGALKTPSGNLFLKFSFGVASVFEDGESGNFDFGALKDIGDERMRMNKLARKKA